MELLVNIVFICSCIAEVTDASTRVNDVPVGCEGRASSASVCNLHERASEPEVRDMRAVRAGDVRDVRTHETTHETPGQMDTTGCHRRRSNSTSQMADLSVAFAAASMHTPAAAAAAHAIGGTLGTARRTQLTFKQSFLVPTVRFYLLLFSILLHLHKFSTREILITPL